MKCHDRGTSATDPYVIWPYYTGRDKGAVSDRDGRPLLFMTAGHAWHHIFFVVQPNDDRAKSNYRVVRLSEYR